MSLLIPVTCPHCGWDHEIPSTDVGRIVPCAECDTPVEFHRRLTIDGEASLHASIPAAPSASPTEASESSDTLWDGPTVDESPRINVLAIASLVTSLLMVLAPLTSPAAIGLGILGLRRTSDPRMGGRRMALAGICIATAGFLVWVPLAEPMLVAAAAQFMKTHPSGNAALADGRGDESHGSAITTELPDRTTVATRPISALTLAPAHPATAPSAIIARPSISPHAAESAPAATAPTRMVAARENPTPTTRVRPISDGPIQNLAQAERDLASNIAGKPVEAARWLKGVAPHAPRRDRILSLLRPHLNDPRPVDRDLFVAAFINWADASCVNDLVEIVNSSQISDPTWPQVHAWAMASMALFHYSHADARGAVNRRLDVPLYRAEMLRDLAPYADDPSSPDNPLAVELSESIRRYNERVSSLGNH